MLPLEKIYVNVNGLTAALSARFDTRTVSVECLGATVPVSVEYGEATNSFMLTLPGSQEHGVIAIKTTDRNGDENYFLIGIQRKIKEDAPIVFVDLSRSYISPCGRLGHINSSGNVTVTHDGDRYTDDQDPMIGKGVNIVGDTNIPLRYLEGDIDIDELKAASEGYCEVVDAITGLREQLEESKKHFEELQEDCVQLRKEQDELRLSRDRLESQRDGWRNFAWGLHVAVNETYRRPLNAKWNKELAAKHDQLATAMSAVFDHYVN